MAPIDVGVSGVVRVDAVRLVGIAFLYVLDPIQRLLQSVGRRPVHVNLHQRFAIVFAFMLCVLCAAATCIKLRYIAFMWGAPPFAHEL